MPSATVGQSVWWMTWDDKHGPFPATVITPGAAPLLVVHAPEGAQRVTCTHWHVEDGTLSGWLEIPDSGEIPADLFT